MRVGVFDSGVGGLTVLKSILDSKLFGEIIYYGDTARVPYGVKDTNTIIRFSLEALEFFKPFEIDMLIVACNTVSARAINDMKKCADFPIVGVVESGVLALSNKIKDKSKKILIIGTQATIKSKSYEKKLQNLGYKNLQSVQTGIFVSLVEEGITSGDLLNAAMRHYFAGIKTPDAIILGCTHFPLISSEIYKYFDNKPALIHSGEAIVERLKNEFKIKGDNCESKIEFFASGDVNNLKKVAKMWL